MLCSPSCPVPWARAHGWLRLCTAAAVLAYSSHFGATQSTAGSGCNVPTAAGYTWADLNLTCTDVSFAGGDGGDGTPIKLYGSVLRPSATDARSGPAPGAMFLSGSGPNDRWSCDSAGVACTFLDLAVRLAGDGVTVLVFDKRSCHAGYNDMCTNRAFCTALPAASTGLPQCSECPGCVDLYNTTLYDFIADGAAAADYLVQAEYVSAAATTVIGHSQGCSYAAEVAALAAVPNVVLLEGTGVGPGAVTSLQSEFQLPIFATYADYLRKTGAPAADLLAAQQQVDVMECFAEYSVAQMDTIRDGTLSPLLQTTIPINSFPVPTPAAVTEALYNALVAKGLNATVLHGMGIERNGTICPGRNITGRPACACDVQGVQDPACQMLCAGAQVAGNGPSVGYDFYASWIDVGSMQYLKNSVSRLPSGARIMATNGWADSKVPLTVFGELHVTLTHNVTRVGYGTYPYGEGNPNVYNLGPVQLSLNTFSNITHDLTDVHAAFDTANDNDNEYDATYFHTRGDVMAVLSNFVCAGPSVQCTAPDTPPPVVAPDVLLIAGIVGVVGGLLVGVAATLFVQWANYKCLQRRAARLGVPMQRNWSSGGGGMSSSGSSSNMTHSQTRIRRGLRHNQSAARSGGGGGVGTGLHAASLNSGGEEEAGRTYVSLNGAHTDSADGQPGWRVRKALV